MFKFKKISILTLLAFIIIGCGNKNEVTENMLAGNWNCEFQPYVAYFYDENGNVLLEKKQDAFSLRSNFYLKNGDLYNGKNQLDLKNLTHTRGDNVIKNKLTYISDDKFTVNHINSLINKEIDYKYYEFETEGVCKRVK